MCQSRASHRVRSSEDANVITFVFFFLLLSLSLSLAPFGFLGFRRVGDRRQFKESGARSETTSTLFWNVKPCRGNPNDWEEFSETAGDMFAASVLVIVEIRVSEKELTRGRG